MQIHLLFKAKRSPSVASLMQNKESVCEVRTQDPENFDEEVLALISAWCSPPSPSLVFATFGSEPYGGEQAKAKSHWSTFDFKFARDNRS